MLIVREVFIAKPGHAGKLAMLMKDMHSGVGSNIRVMTDLTGVFNKVVVESEFEHLADFEKSWMDYMAASGAKLEKLRAEYQGMYAQGKREIYRVV
jgi:hypothetical protein